MSQLNSDFWSNPLVMPASNFPNGITEERPSPNTASQGIPEEASGYQPSWWDLLAGPLWTLSAQEGYVTSPSVVGDRLVQGASQAAAVTSNELATAYDWGKSAIKDVAAATEDSLVGTIRGVGNVSQGVGLGILGAGTFLFLGGILLALYLFSKRDVIIEHAAKGAGAAAAAGAV